jgi:DNA polymerase-1
MTTLLIDGDVVAYKIAASIERPTDWGDGLWTLHSDADEGIALLEDHLLDIRKKLGGKDHVVALTDQEANWRLSVWSDYKANRKGTRRPLCLGAMRKHLLENHRCYLRPRLEGDDVLGILATHPSLIPGPKVLVSVDKDFFTVPGHFFRGAGSSQEVVEVTPEAADRYHMLQTLTGDATDGYPGCPGVGPVAAEKALDDMTRLIPYQHVLSRGPRKGEEETRFREEPAESVWEVVVSRYEAAELTEADALIQARVARILRHTDYDFANKRVRLWSPPR